ncbi:hypothetical protein L0664_00060 [Octadecabacter sp. G9-8]|uniref:Calcium-binding protein n=1 Tax=Octadecabacter dasysiphoniae TaxID=2909341 RepID=A0ABS9CTT8_9RHOB|nr:calcium-binding protein [Octadecabacter dasysiphoniae]MCF2869448.1 hypothetical protein [Octadecabacter dasysiphoniae]
MASQLEYIAVEGDKVTDYMFGGNLLANRGEIYGEGQYDTAINDLGVTTLRYPGGSRTEKSFDITDPDAEQVVDKQTGQVDDWIALTDFFSYAQENGHPVSIVVPTRFNLSDEVDESGNRTPDFNDEELRTFIRNVATGKYGDPEITTFEIGNEYWHSGQMNSVEYGRLAVAMTEIIHDELDAVAAEFPDSADIQITVQMGLNYGYASLSARFDGMDTDVALAAANLEFGLNLGDKALYSSGTINWGYVSNMIIINEFEENQSMHLINGVIAHVYSLGESNEWSRVSELKLVEDTWMENYPDLDIHVTEWNQRGVTEQLDRHEDYGLHQAEEILNLMEEFIRAGVDFAQVWPLLQFTDNALNFGFVYEETNAPGAMFRMMADNLPGKSLLDFNPASEYVTEVEFEHISVHGFADQTDLVLYITPNGSVSVANTDLDLNSLFSSFDSMQLTVLGVEEGGFGLGSNATSATFTDLKYIDFFDDGVLAVSLNEEEILQVVIEGYIPTDAFSELILPEHVDDDYVIEFLSGGTGNDLIFGGAGDDLIEGQEGDDVLLGEDGNDLLMGGDGNDSLSGHNGKDALDGGKGEDILTGDKGEDTISGRKGDDQIFGGNGDDLLKGNDGDDFVGGGDGHDNITGGLGSDEIKGGHHSDSIRGGDGNDLIDGGHGNDTIRGNDGSDVITGDDGNDRIWAGAGRDLVYGGTGDDVISGNVGNDIIHGGEGNDSLSGNNGSDQINGGIGNDQLNGGNGADEISGNFGDDLIFGGNGRDALFGGDGSDFLGGGDGTDELYGGAGSDDIKGGHNSDIVGGGDGDDTIDGGHGDDEIRGNDGSDIITGDEGSDQIWGGAGDDQLFGGMGDDFIVGNIGNDTIIGGSGDDTLSGNSGDDVIDGGNGDDVLIGGSGADVFEFNSGVDVISDFESKIDSLVLDDSLWGHDTLTFEKFQSFSSSSNGGGIKLDFGDGNSLEIQGDVNLGELFDDLI